MDQHDSANFRGRLNKAIQTTSNSHENATLQELHSLQNDFDVLNVSYSNTTAALNEAMLKNHELEREHSDIKMAFLGLQEENKSCYRSKRVSIKTLSTYVLTSRKFTTIIHEIAPPMLVTLPCKGALTSFHRPFRQSTNQSLMG